MKKIWRIFFKLVETTNYHGNPQPSFFGVINLHFSWFWGPRVENGDFFHCHVSLCGGVYLPLMKTEYICTFGFAPPVIVTTRIMTRFWWGIPTSTFKGVPNGSQRVWILHPLGFNWHLFEGPGINLYLFDWFDLFATGILGGGIDPISTRFGFWFGKLFVVIHKLKEKPQEQRTPGTQQGSKRSHSFRSQWKLTGWHRRTMCWIVVGFSTKSRTKKKSYKMGP